MLYKDNWLKSKLKWFSVPQDWYGFGPIYKKTIKDSFFIKSYDTKSLTKFITYNSRFIYLNSIGSPPNYRVKGEVNIFFKPNIFFNNSFDFDSNGLARKDSNTLEHETVGSWTGYLQNSTTNFIFPNSYLIIGRSNLFLNTFNKSLLVNGEIKPSEMIFWHYSKDAFEFDWSIVSLNKVSLESKFKRSLVLHRYGYSHSNFEIGFTEAAIMKYESLTGDYLNYMFPSAIIFETEVNQNQANIFFLLDGYYRISSSIYFFAELLVDDFSLDRLSPHKIAHQSGLQIDLGQLKIRGNYIRINRWVGSYFDSDLIMYDNGIKIGHPIGPDAQKFQIDLIFMPKDWVSLEFSGAFLNKGEGEIDEEHPVSSTSNYGYHYEKFPSGENQLLIDLFFNIDMILSERNRLSFNLARIEDGKLQVGILGCLAF